MWILLYLSLLLNVWLALMFDTERWLKDMYKVDSNKYFLKFMDEWDENTKLRIENIKLGSKLGRKK
jgi:hypothetical protein